MEKDFNYVRLCDIYGALLTSRQLDIMLDIYEYDLNLSEIALKHGVTRQCVSITHKQALSTLDDCEARLKIVSKIDRLKRELNCNAQQLSIIDTVFFS